MILVPSVSPFSLCFFASNLPLTIGKGPSHVQPWAYGDHCMLPDDSLDYSQFAPLYARLDFESLSRFYEITVLDEAGALIDGHVYGKVLMPTPIT